MVCTCFGADVSDKKHIIHTPGTGLSEIVHEVFRCLHAHTACTVYKTLWTLACIIISR